MMSQQGDVGHAGGPQRDRHRHGHQRHAPVYQRGLPGPRQRGPQRGPQRGGQPRLVGQLAQQHGPGVPDQALAVPGHFQRVVPARILHHEERSCLGDSNGVVTA
jgi:hypothetical protein